MQPTLSIAADAPSCPVGAVTFTVTRAGDLSGPTTAEFKASNGQTGTLWFGGGEGAKKVWLTVASPGSVSVTLSKPSGAKIASGSANCMVGGAAPQPAPTPTPLPSPAPATSPAAGMVLTFQPDLTQPLDLYHATENPSGLWKPNAPWDKDGEVKKYMEQWSRWPDHPMSRSASLDLQTFVDPVYNGMSPFSTGPDGITITASRNPSPSDRAPAAYVSGLLSTQFSFAQRYGYFECDVTCPPARGAWPAFWMLGQAESPEANKEIDIMERLGGRPGSSFINAHLLEPGQPDKHIPGVEVTGLGDRITAGLLWTKDTLAFFVNGIERNRVANPGFHKPMFILTSLAVGPEQGSGGWADINTPVDDAAFPARCTFHRISAWRLP